MLPRIALALTFATLAVAQDAPQRRLSGSRPNIIFLFSDDHAPHAISAYGSRINETPNIDRLAQNGVLFRNNFCGNSICGPSRATILTGLHTHAHGFMRNGNRFDGSQTTFPKLLQQAGYTTAMIGKWHLTSDPTGFDFWRVLPGQGHYYNPDFLTPEGRERFPGHATNLTTEFAIDWLENGRDKDKPFVLMCQHKAPHRSWMPAPEELGLYRDLDIPEPATLFDDYEGRTPAARHTEMEIDRHMYMFYDLKLVPTPEQEKDLKGPDPAWKGLLGRMDAKQRAAWDAAYRDENEAFYNNPPEGKDLVRWKYQRYIKNYLRCVAGVDRSVGQMLDWLDAHPDIKQNTIVVYSSDQGFYLGDHGWYDKRWMYEESFKMPLLVSWPDHIAAGREAAELSQNIDFAPTFLDLAGVPVPATMHGKSLVPVLEGRTTPGAEWRSALYYHYYESQAVHMVPAHFGVRTDRYKLIRYYEPQWDAWELYDLESDPDELHNLYDDPAHQELVAQLKQRLVELRKEYDDTTGTLGDGAFQYTAGIASTVKDGDGYRVWANASGGYLLQDVPEEHRGRGGVWMLETTMMPVQGRQQQNGYLLLTGGEPRRQIVRVGVAFRDGKLHVVGPNGMKEQTKTAIHWDGKKPLQVTVAVDFDAHIVVVSALDHEIEASIPEQWKTLTAYGYGASNAETRFGPIVVH